MKDAYVGGSLPKGCELCIQGAKMVVFTTGVCGMKCFYCPLSFKRKMKNQPFANERKIMRLPDLIREAELMRAKGASMTGGDPVMSFARTVRYVRALKKRFGAGFHIHMYTTGERATPAKLKALCDAGVDEIRFHFNCRQILDALRLPWIVGAEVPAVPGKWEETAGYFKFLWESGARFCNLNELDWSEQNVEAFKRRGYRLKSGESYAAKGSEQMALRLVRYARRRFPGLTVHYCSSQMKDAVQVRKRFIRTAKNVARPFERVDSDGLLVKGFVAGERRLLEVPARLQAYSRKKKRVEFPERLAASLAAMPKYRGRVFVASEQPTADAVDLEIEPVGQRSARSGF